jgi:dihydrolipoamide dehydrogenase
MPSKLLIAAADVAHEVRGAELFGIEAPAQVRVRGPAVLERVRRERDRFVGFVVEATEELPEEQRLRGHARFAGPTTLEVDGHTRVEAKAVAIAAGSHPWIPPPLEPLREKLMVNDDVFELGDLPESLAVVGTGIIGLELGQALRRLGVRTAFFSHSAKLGPITDPEVAAVMRKVFGGELDLHLNVELEASEAPEGGFLVRWRTQEGGEGEERFERILAAAGRRPSLDGLSIEKTGVELDPRGVPRFNPHTMQCGESPIFLAGDVSADRPLLHEAADEGRIAGINAARFPDVRAQMRRTPLSVMFTDPEVAIAGKSFRELDPDQTAVGQVSYEDQGRARVMGRNAGLVRIYAERDCGILVGAEMFGPRVEHTAHLLAWAMQSRLSVDRALEMPFYHPVVEEGIRTALRDLSAQLKILAPARAQDLECGPGT